MGMKIMQKWVETLQAGLGHRFLGFFVQIARFLWAKERNSEIAILSLPRANRSRGSFLKSDEAKSEGGNSLLGLKRGKAVKHCQKTW